MAESTELERVYTIPLRRAFRHAPRVQKTNRAVKEVRNFLVKHMKASDVKLGQHLNHFLWDQGIKSPPPRVTVKAVKDGEGVVRAELEGKTFTESVRPIPKEEEPEGLKEKLTSKLGVKDDKTEKPEEKKEEKASEKPATPAPKKTAPAKPAAKPTPSS